MCFSNFYELGQVMDLDEKKSGIFRWEVSTSGLRWGSCV